ncbi:hypothetical protein KKA13_03755 [Patescibacteria group bacterium]|nr:hypothetical protein [Patescibacteria group bacterium]
MYVYIYDNFVRDRKYNSLIKALEIRLTDYGIAGKILYLHNYIDSKAIIDEEMRRGASTIVIVGNDRTFGQVLSRSAGCECVFGFIPVGPENTIADILGIPIGLEAADVLARRRKEKLDVGWVNGRYFVTQLHVMPAKISVLYDEKFKVSSTGLMEMVVCNFKPFYFKRSKRDNDYQVVHPQDGKLEAFLRPLTKKGWRGYSYEEPSIFPFEEMEISGDEAFSVEADGKVTKEVKITIKLARNKINMVVGRNRKF